MMNTSTTANPSSGVIILQGTQNYLEWLFTIEMAAKSGTQDVWNYINPSLSQTARLAIPDLSDKPKPSDIKPTALTVSGLTGPEVEDYKIRLAEWKENKLEIDDMKRLIGLIQNKVLGSISEKLLPQLKGKSTVSEILYYLN